MPTFDIQTRPVVMSDCLREPVVLRSTQLVEGRTFWRVAKADQIVGRLLLGKACSSERMLSRTDIIEQLVKLRNSKVAELMQPPGPLEDLGLDEQPEAAPAPPAGRPMPPTVQILAPQIGDVPELSLVVLSGLGQAPLWVELLPSVLEYLSEAVASQIAQGNVKRSKPSEHRVAHRGINFDAGRVAYRARRPDGKQRYFREEACGDARAAAVEWLEEWASEPSAIADADPMAAPPAEAEPMVMPLADADPVIAPPGAEANPIAELDLGD